jgi:alkaline phosphatase D
MAGAWTRRQVGGGALGAAAALMVPHWNGRALAQERGGVQVPYGVQTGDVTGDRAIVWARADRPARMHVRWATTERFDDARHAPVVDALEPTDLAGKVDLAGLPAGQRVFVEVTFTDLADLQGTSRPVVASFVTPPAARRGVRLVWSGDTAGQGYGINPDLGGMRIYRTMLEQQPDLFIHSGDTIYADNPIQAEATGFDGRPVLGPDGKPWRNVTTEAKAKVAETLAEFRANYAYNLLDEHLRAFNAAVPMLAQWDDHEVTNNWYWQKRMDADRRYAEKSVALMAARGSRAFFDWMPVRGHALEPQRLYSSFRWGPSLEIFRIDLRSYRGPNTDGLEIGLDDAARVLGAAQVRWLQQALLASDATWKIIASDMPIGLIVWDDFRNRKGVEAIAQGEHGAAKGRELEIAGLLRFIRDAGIRNTVWLTADVHYTAAHRYDPGRAAFQEFEPFWEFVSGPLNAGTFGPNELDRTFGPEAVFVKAPDAGQVNLPPSFGQQFFGQVDIDGTTDVMTVRLKDIEGRTLFTQDLAPAA